MIAMGLVLVALSVVYLIFAWNRYQKMAKAEAILLAESVQSLLHAEHIAILTGNPRDVASRDYQLVKRNLLQLVQTNHQIRFAYLLGRREDSLIFLIDSETETSPDYSPPGQIYHEATADDLLPFTAGISVLSGPMQDRWGTWYSALIPVKDPITQNTIAVLGIDYSVKEWNQRIIERIVPDVLIVFSLYAVCIALFITWKSQQEIKARAAKLALDEALFHSVFDQAPIGISIVEDKSFSYQPEQGALTMNSMFEKILGRTRAELVGIQWPDITFPEDLPADTELFKRFSSGEIDGYTLEKRFIKPDSSLVWTNMIIASITEKNVPYARHLCLLEDITARKAIEAELKESERSKAVLLSHLPGLAYRCKYGETWTMLFVSAGCLKLTGYPPEALLNNRDLSYHDIIAQEYRDAYKREWERVLPGKDFFKKEYEIITAQGERRWVLELGRGIFRDTGEVEALEGIILDVTDRKMAESILKYSSEYDVWTGLHNRAYLEELLRTEQPANRFGKRALIGINLSTMHVLNMTYGFHYCQKLIKRAALALSVLCNANRTLFYTYENRFVFYITNYTEKNELAAFCAEIVHALKSVLAVERIGGGIGIIEIGGKPVARPDRVLKNLLLASEKSMGNIEADFAYSFYDEHMESLFVREEKIRRDLLRVTQGESGARLFLQYQPIYDVKAERIVGFEALARLASDALGTVSPVEFIPIAEKTKLILPLGKEIIRQALRFLSRLRPFDGSATIITINVSVIQILQEGFLEDLLLLIKETGIDPKEVYLELTESVFSSRYNDVNGILGRIKEHGIKIAIDDFGTGYSSFSRERELNIDCLKIDKCFIDNLVQIREEEAITGDIISMAHKLGHCVIAEGVEQPVQLDYLRRHNCDMVQGYYISMPVDEETAIELLRAVRKL